MGNLFTILFAIALWAACVVGVAWLFAFALSISLWKAIALTFAISLLIPKGKQ